MYITRNEKRALDSAINYMNRRLEVNVEAMNDFEAFSEKMPIEWGVNWCAKGTQSAEEAVKYAANLTRAARMARALTALKIVEDWDGGEVVNTREEFDDLRDGIISALDDDADEYIMQNIAAALKDAAIGRR